MAEAQMIPEFFAFLVASPLLQLTPVGDGHAVLVIPPFGCDDRATTPIRGFLTSRGYRVHGWDLGRNLMATPRLTQQAPQRVEELHARSGGPVSLVGWSAGGLWARSLARRMPGHVRQVITLGTPFRLRPGERTNAEFLYDLVQDAELPARNAMWQAEDTSTPLPMPVTAIYSRADGIASWRQCLEERSDRRENIEVYGSHSGLAHNVAAVAAVADRLAQPAGTWRPFVPHRSVRHLYPRPRHWEPSTTVA
jgi:pimeloyl-ACP methyl ester carboxylesterase